MTCRAGDCNHRLPIVDTFRTLEFAVSAEIGLLLVEPGDWQRQAKQL